MQDQDKEKLIRTLIIGSIVLIILSRGALLLPMIIGVIIYFYFKNQKKNNNIINANKNFTMGNINFDTIQKKVKNTMELFQIKQNNDAYISSAIVMDLKHYKQKIVINVLQN